MIRPGGGCCPHAGSSVEVMHHSDPLHLYSPFNFLFVAGLWRDLVSSY